MGQGAQNLPGSISSLITSYPCRSLTSKHSDSNQLIQSCLQAPEETTGLSSDQQTHHTPGEPPGSWPWSGHVHCSSKYAASAFPLPARLRLCGRLDQAPAPPLRLPEPAKGSMPLLQRLHLPLLHSLSHAARSRHHAPPPPSVTPTETAETTTTIAQTHISRGCFSCNSSSTFLPSLGLMQVPAVQRKSSHHYRGALSRGSQVPTQAVFSHAPCNRGDLRSEQERRGETAPACQPTPRAPGQHCHKGPCLHHHSLLGKDIP